MTAPRGFSVSPNALRESAAPPRRAAPASSCLRGNAMIVPSWFVPRRGTLPHRHRRRTAHGAVCGLSAGREPDEREDARVEEGLRGGRIRRREDGALERKRGVRRPRVEGGRSRAEGGDGDEGAPRQGVPRHRPPRRRAARDARERSVSQIPAAVDAKRVVTFLREPRGNELALPIELDGARILSVQGTEVFSAYVPGPKGPVFMTLIEKTFGKDVTTRTWDTVRKVAK